MQQSEELLPYTLVASQRRFHPLENPLFAYLTDCYGHKKRDEIERNPGFERVVEWDKEGRQALFFHQAVVPVDFPIFQNFDLIDLHVSVDSKLVDTDSIPHRKLPPHHVSLVYINRKTEEKMTVRIEYTGRGNFIYAKLQHQDSSFSHPSLSVIQQEYLLLQASSSQHLLQSFLQAKQQAQFQLLLEVENLDKQLKNDDVHVMHAKIVLQDLIDRLTLYVRYSGCWDGRIDMYQGYLNRLHLLEPELELELELESEPMQVSAVDVSELNKEISLRAHVQRKKQPKNREQRIITHIDTWLAQAPVDPLDSAKVIAWITTHIANFIVLDELCLCHFCDAPASRAQPFIQAQWQRLPTCGTLLDYFTKHLFLGHSELVRDIAPLMYESTELYHVYARFLHAIESETTLRAERIVTAHVLYDISPLYKNVLMSKRYSLSDDGENLSGILVDLFLQDKFEVFCMYVDQDMASDTVLQLLLPGIPYHAVGAIIALFYTQPRAADYLDKLLSRHSYIVLPHIENLDLGLYQINGKNIKRDKKNTYMIERESGKKKIVLSDMSQHSAITLLRLALNMYTGYFHKGGDSGFVSQSPELLRILAQHTSPELLIKETMKFFENSFFVTMYSSPYQRSVHPDVMMAGDMTTLIDAYQASVSPEGQSIRLLLGLVLDHADQEPFADITRRNAQQLLTQCLMVFSECSLDEQILIVRNLNQLALAALRKQHYKECLFITRALIFCCLSAQAPTVEFHDILLRAIFLFISARGAQNAFMMLPYLKKLAVNYVKGLPEPERVLLNRNNPALMRRITGDDTTQTMFDRAPTTSTDEAIVSSSALISKDSRAC